MRRGRTPSWRDMAIDSQGYQHRQEHEGYPRACCWGVTLIFFIFIAEMASICVYVFDCAVLLVVYAISDNDFIK